MLITRLKDDNLTKDEIIELIDLYDTYIINFCDDNIGYKIGEDVTPACFLEWYDNEYQEILEARYN